MRKLVCCRVFRKYKQHKSYYNWLFLFLACWLALSSLTQGRDFNAIKIVVSGVLLSEFISFVQKESSDPIRMLVSLWMGCMYFSKLSEIGQLRELAPTQNSVGCVKFFSEYGREENCFEPCNEVASFLLSAREISKGIGVGNIPAFLHSNVKYMIYGDKYNVDILERYSCEAVAAYVADYNQGALFHLIRYITWSLFIEHLLKGICYVLKGMNNFFIYAIRFLPIATEH